VITFVVLAAVSLCHSADAPASQASPDVLILDLDAGGKRHTLYEPIELTYRVTNPTQSDVRTYLQFSGNRIRITIQPEGGTAISYSGGLTRDVIGGWPEHVLHGATRFEESERLYFNPIPRGLTFPRTGHYTIRAELDAGNSEQAVVLHSEVNVKVTDPSTDDSALINDLGSPDALISVLRDDASRYCADGGKPDCLDRLLHVARAHPDSAYSPFILMEVIGARSWMNQLEQPNFPLELGLFQEFLDRYPKHPVAWRAEATLPSLLHKMGKNQEAVDAVHRFEKAHPDRRNFIHHLHESILREAVEN